MKKIYLNLKSGIILHVLALTIMATANRGYWLNSESLYLGSMQAESVVNRFGVKLNGLCNHEPTQQVEFKVLPDQTIQFRCSFFSGSGIAWWPFYTAYDIKSASATAEFNAMFKGVIGGLGGQ